MSWRVLWSEQAGQALVQTLRSSRHKQSIAETCRRIDEMLQRDPESVGESRDQNRRIVIVLLGLGFLSRFVVTFDLPNGRIFMTPVETVLPMDQEAWCGLHLLKQEDAVVVHSVANASPAAAAAILAEDVIRSLDGEDVRNLS